MQPPNGTVGRVPFNFGDHGDQRGPLQLLQLAVIFLLGTAGRLQCFPRPPC